MPMRVTGPIARESLADYIPELTRVNPEAFGIAVATVDGGLHTVGDTDKTFTIQSVSKAFVYCLALELAGREAVLARVGVEPSGDALQRDRVRSAHQHAVQSDG